MANERQRTHHEVDDQELIRFNSRREIAAAKGTVFNPKELREVMRMFGYPQNSKFKTCITHGENPPIIHVKRGQYAFNPNVVHIERLKLVWKEYEAYGKPNEAEKASKERAIQDAITLLRDNNYRVLKLQVREEWVEV